MKIFCDDTRGPEQCVNDRYYVYQKSRPVYLTNDWVVVRTYKDFCDLLHVRTDEITHVSLDYDLGGNMQIKTVVDPTKWYDIQAEKEFTGYDCAKFLKEFFEGRNLPLPVIYVHSMNSRGEQDVLSLFKEK